MRKVPPAIGLTLRDFDIHARLCFLAGWMPRTPDEPWRLGHDRWNTWAEYLADFAAVRAELIARHGADGRPIFADRVREYRRVYGAAALDGATFDQLRADIDPED